MKSSEPIVAIIQCLGSATAKSTGAGGILPPVGTVFSIVNAVMLKTAARETTSK